MWSDTFIRKSGNAMLDPLDQKYGYSWGTASSDSFPMLEPINASSKDQRNVNDLGWTYRKKSGTQNLK